MEKTYKNKIFRKKMRLRKLPVKFTGKIYKIHTKRFDITVSM